jgi:hypothetical protein
LTILASSSARELGGVIAAAQEVFRSPHVHHGTGARNLRGRWYEAQVGRERRLVFRECDDCLSFEFIGNHDDVQRFLKSAK